MKTYVIDTNIYVDALRSAERAQRLQSFVSANLAALILHAVVAQELLAGATSQKKAGDIHGSLIRPFETRGRVMTPTFEDWKAAGEIMAALVQRRWMSPGGFRRSFLADCILAASCARNGLTLITTNERDFELIGRVQPLDVVLPWPEPSMQ